MCQPKLVICKYVQKIPIVLVFKIIHLMKTIRMPHVVELLVILVSIPIRLEILINLLVINPEPLRVRKTTLIQHLIS